MSATDQIINSTTLTAVFGYWPTFHDAEVLSIRLDRQHRDVGHGLVLEVVVHTFEMTSEIGIDGCYVLRHHVLVHFRFYDVVELQMSDFNHQNALFGIAFTDLSERQLEDVKWAVSLDSSFGVDLSFECRSIEVVTVNPCDKLGKRQA